MFGHIVGLFSNPENEWHVIRKKLENNTCQYTTLVFLLAMIPPVCGLIGTTQFGWQIGTAEPVKLAMKSAVTIAVAYYFAIVLGIFIMGYVIKWMGQTYVKNVRLSESVALAVFVAVPLLLVGVFEIFPILWVNFLVGLVALGYSVFLLYSGVPVLMDIPKEKGFLYASAILGFGMVALVSMLIITALLWGVGLQPTFSN
ncbi:MAG: YIP1 family protein [Proteobacteria bacterium]|nr:YIP1 family protein [Pseudomonadota bacterium]